MSGYVDIARLIATHAHAGQVDKAGRDYIDHPAAVAAAVAHHGPEYEAAGWLHDVIEDTPWSLAMIRKTGREASAPIPTSVCWALIALTRRSGDTYEEAIYRATVNPIARVVKLADNAHNANPDRLALLDASTAKRLRAKYAKARKMLEAAG